LKCDQVNLNQRTIVDRLVAFLRDAAKEPSNEHSLEVVRRYYFSNPDGTLPKEAGWYVILDSERMPLYVGSAENLDSRLNSDDGSRDNFANPQRKHEPKRNLIKKLRLMGVSGDLTVLTYRESAVCEALEVTAPLSPLDRHNVEGFLDVIRHKIVAAG